TFHLPALAEAAKRVISDRPARFVVVAASDHLAQEFAREWPEECGGAGAIVRGDASGVVVGADLAWTASGTAVLETALRGVPQIAFYRISESQYRVAQRVIPKIVRGPITLPNLVTGAQIVPELLQDKLTPDALTALTMELLDVPAARARIAS